MANTLRRGRIPFDNYPTPQPLADEICLWLQREASLGLADVTHIIEPSAGAGAFVRAARAVWPRSRITAIDIRDTRRLLRAAGADEVHCGDWLRWVASAQLQKHGQRILILGNPPFLRAEAHARAALSLLGASGVLALLLRVGFLGSEERVPFWRDHPLRGLRSIVPRPSYDGEGQDGSEYATFLWGERLPPYLGGPLLWEKPSGRDVSAVIRASSLPPSASSARAQRIATADQRLHLAQEQHVHLATHVRELEEATGADAAGADHQSLLATARRDLFVAEQRLRSARWEALRVRMGRDQRTRPLPPTQLALLTGDGPPS